MLQTILYVTIGIYFAYYIVGVVITAMRTDKTLHARFAKMLPWVTIVEILVIVICVLLSKRGDNSNNSAEFKIHIWLAIATLISIFVQWWFDGNKKPRFHKIFHFIVTILFTITTITGLQLVSRL